MLHTTHWTACILASQSTVSLSALSQSQNFEVKPAQLIIFIFNIIIIIIIIIFIIIISSSSNFEREDIVRFLDFKICPASKIRLMM